MSLRASAKSSPSSTIRAGSARPRSRFGLDHFVSRSRTRPTRRVLPALFVADDKFHHLFESKQPFLTAKRLFTSQTFRELFRTDTLGVDQRLKLTSLTVLFTDLKGSTALYERVGDLVAYEIVQAHFHVLGDVVRVNSGAIVKTIGDAVMATFPTPDHGLRAALEMRDAMDRLNKGQRHEISSSRLGCTKGRAWRSR